MACNKCNEEHRETAKFCDNCGTRLEKNRMNLKTIIALAVCLSAFIIVMTVVIRKANSKLKPCRSEEKNSLTEPSGKVFLTSLVKHQNRIISGLGMKLIYVAPGTFQMGSNDGESDEKPVHEVTISKGFWIGKYELTQREYQLITETNPSYYKGCGKPVECVSWNDAIKFCKKLTEREHRAGRLPTGYEYRLPTEAEWEYAAHGGNKSKGYKYSGSNNIDKVAWYGSNSGKQTRDVGTKSANELGIHDMSGNVWEWCLDTCNKSGVVAGLATDTYKNGMTDPLCTNSYRTFRGGGWYRDARLCRVTNRAGNSPDRKLYYLGFRIVLGQKFK